MFQREVAHHSIISSDHRDVALIAVNDCLVQGFRLCRRRLLLVDDNGLALGDPMHSVDRPSFLHVAFELLVCRSEVEANDIDSARSSWILVAMGVCPLLLSSLTSTRLTPALLDLRKKHLC